MLHVMSNVTSHKTLACAEDTFSILRAPQVNLSVIWACHSDMAKSAGVGWIHSETSDLYQSPLFSATDNMQPIPTYFYYISALQLFYIP